MSLARSVLALIVSFAVLLFSGAFQNTTSSGARGFESTTATASVIVLRQRSEINFYDGKPKTRPPDKAEIQTASKPNSPSYMPAYRAGKFRRFRNLLIAARVPFEPNILLGDNWRDHVKNYGDFIAARGNFIANATETGGAIIADTVVRPSKVRFSSDTVIVANRILFGGPELEIKARGKGIAIFPVEYIEGVSNSLQSAQRIAEKIKTGQKSDSLLLAQEKTPKKKILVSVDGFGAQDRKKAAESNIDLISYFLSEGFCDGIEECPRTQDGGRDGASGINGISGNRGNDSPDPVDGSCILGGSPNGRNTPNASDGSPGENGRDEVVLKSGTRVLLRFYSFY